MLKVSTWGNPHDAKILHNLVQSSQAMRFLTNSFLKKLTPSLLIKIFKAEDEDLANKKYAPINFVKLL